MSICIYKDILYRCVWCIHKRIPSQECKWKEKSSPCCVCSSFGFRVVWRRVSPFLTLSLKRHRSCHYKSIHIAIKFSDFLLYIIPPLSWRSYILFMSLSLFNFIHNSSFCILTVQLFFLMEPTDFYISFKTVKFPLWFLDDRVLL